MAFNPARLDLAMKRRRCTARSLSETTGITVVSLSRIKQGKQSPEPGTVANIAAALKYPAEFFSGEDFDTIPSEAVSFRSLSSVTQREKDAATAAGSIGYAVADWLNSNYNLPVVNLLDCGPERDAPAAARALRQHWALGEKPIGNIIKLLESKGVRVFSLAEDTPNIDAFSCWRNSEAYIFLNTFKTTERSRFDAAHELGHLVLHKHGGSDQGRQAESEANAFASAFLMPELDVLSNMPRVSSLAQVIRGKKRWGVSAKALIYRLKTLGCITDWQNQTFNIQVTTNFGREEPDGLPRETSFVWKTVLDDLWAHRRTRDHVADEIGIPRDELANLVFGLVHTPSASAAAGRGKPELRLVD